jgi:hypothetical protein
MLEVKGLDGELWYKIDAPILGVIRDAEPTDYGWTGIMPNGGAIEGRSDHPGVHAQIPDHHLRWRRDGELVGVYLIEHRRRKRARRKVEASL